MIVTIARYVCVCACLRINLRAYTCMHVQIRIHTRRYRGTLLFCCTLLCLCDTLTHEFEGQTGMGACCLCGARACVYMNACAYIQ